MTRKCVLCKESNYKNAYSFFSAPKDASIRKSWENALSMEVTDDTYICSKHFHHNDIITHWFSGVPPHVITIKYKKCRLRPGAIPIVGVEYENNHCEKDEDDFLELRVNRTDSSFNSLKRKTNKTILKESEASTNLSSVKTTKQSEATLDLSDNKNMIEIKSEPGCLIMPHKIPANNSDNDSANDTVSYDDEDVREYILRTEGKKKYVVQNSKKKQKTNRDCSGLEFENIAETVEVQAEEDKIMYLSSDSQGEQTMEIWHVDLEQKIKVEEKVTLDLSKDQSQESMLFEDLLEVYTEVTLPKGWSALVIPKGHDTMIVYSFINTSNSRIPFVEKQVYLKSDMLLHCGTSTTEIDPFEHGLVKDGRSRRVQTLVDLEDVIEELDQRHVCEGFNANNCTQVNYMEHAIREGTKWRHIECPILVNNDLSACSKCSSLSVLSKKRRRPEDFILAEVSSPREAETRLSASSIASSIINAIDNLNIPEIQKVMMKECLKNNAELDARKSIKFSKTWIFLCVLLYLESPRMYRYLLLNNYLCLPSLFTIKRYLHRIKTEPRFYSIFQRSIEPFQPTLKNGQEEKSGRTYVK